MFVAEPIVVVWLVGRFANRPYGLAGGLHREGWGLLR